MLNSVVSTLSKLASVANSEGNKAAADKKDKTSPQKAKALFAKQAHIASVVTELNTLSNAIAAHPEMQPLFNGVLDKLALPAIKPLEKLQHPHKDLTAALNSGAFISSLNVVSQTMQGIKRNIELKEMANQEFAKSDQAKAKNDAIKQQEAEDLAFINVLNTNAHQLKAALDASNRKWAALLKRVFNSNDLPENKPAPVVANNSFGAFGDFISTFFDAVTGLFTGMTNAKDNDYKAPMLAFSATMIPMVLNFVGSIFKPLLGANAGEKIQGFTKAISDFFMKMLSEERPEPDAPPGGGGSGGAPAAPAAPAAAPAPIRRSISQPALTPARNLAATRSPTLAQQVAPVNPAPTQTPSIMDSVGGVFGTIARKIFGQ